MSVRPNHPKYHYVKSTYEPAPRAAYELSNTSVFKAVCKKENVEPTIRQARAYLAKRGRWKNY